MGCKLLFMGDIYLQDISREKEDNIFIDDFQKLVDTCEYICCNYEGPIKEEAENIKISKQGPSIGQSARQLHKLVKAGVNIFDLANNHTMDYGLQGLDRTLEYMKNVNVLGVGHGKSETYKYQIFKTNNNLQVGIVAIAEGGFGVCKDEFTSGYAWMQDNYVEELIMNAKKECDMVVTICHAGAEELNIPLPEIRHLYKKFIDWGSDVVIGHHPHVIQGKENYMHGTIYYSLGNAAFDSVANPEKAYNPQGICILIDIENNKSYNIQVIPTLYSKGLIGFDITQISISEFEKSCMILANDQEYIQQINFFCVKMFNEVYQKYYINITDSNFRTIKNKMQMIIRILIGYEKFDIDMLYHNIAIETHRWICVRAIELLYKFKKE